MTYIAGGLDFFKLFIFYQSESEVLTLSLTIATLGPVGKTCGLGPERHYFRLDPASHHIASATDPPSHLSCFQKVGTQIFTPTPIQPQPNHNPTPTKPYPNPIYS